MEHNNENMDEQNLKMKVRCHMIAATIVLALFQTNGGTDTLVKNVRTMARDPSRDFTESLQLKSIKDSFVTCDNK